MIVTHELVESTYRSTRLRYTELAELIGDERARATTCSATPEWSLADVFAHQAGVAADAMAGNLDGVATDPWTAEQVASRSQLSLSEIVAEWAATAVGFEAVLAQVGADLDPRLLLDQWTHEQDLRGAIGVPGGGDSHVLSIWESMIEASIIERLTGAGLAPVDLTGLDMFERIRMMTGRRSRAQFREYGWDVDDLAAYIDALVIFSPAASDIHDAR